MRRVFKLTLLIIYIAQNCRAKIMRNNALMSKMVSQFQGKETLEPALSGVSNPTNVLALMQNVLCKNFPSIPCDVIVQDETLRNLIEKSIQQLKYKKLTLEKSTPAPRHHLTLFPVLNSEDLSNFLQVSDTGYYKQNKIRKPKQKKQKKSISSKRYWSQERLRMKNHSNKKDSKRTTVYSGNKKLRKFYPHKVKYKDKNSNFKKDFVDYSQEKLSMSVEIPEVNNIRKKHQQFSYKTEPTDSAVWRIDYMKHGEPSLNVFGYEADSLKGKIMKTGPNVIVDENVLEHAARKDVLHPDVYIKNNFVRNIETNSEVID